MAYYGHLDPPPDRCTHCERRGHDADDCLMRPAACERCGKMWTRDDLFWDGDELIGDCCDAPAWQQPIATWEVGQ